MPKTRAEQAGSLAGAIEWIEGLEGDPELAAQGWTTDDLRAVVDARVAVEQGRAALAAAVQAARANGRPWQLLAIPLGISRQAAREQYGP